MVEGVSQQEPPDATSRITGTREWHPETSHDFMPQVGPMVDHGVTVVNEPGNPNHQRNVSAWAEYRRYIAGVPGPKIMVVQHLDAPQLVGACRGGRGRPTATPIAR